MVHGLQLSPCGQSGLIWKYIGRNPAIYIAYILYVNGTMKKFTKLSDKMYSFH